MKDKKDSSTLELPGFSDGLPVQGAAPTARCAPARPRKSLLRQEQLELLEATDTTGLPLWRRDDNTDVTGLPIWAAA